MNFHWKKTQVNRIKQWARWYLLQELVVQSVCAVELEHHVPGEGVFDAAHHVFCLSLRQLHRLRGLEERAKTLELWDGRQLFCRTGQKAETNEKQRRGKFFTH